jgi:signal transduction histidine kinase/CheY-like chemotaxis protein
LGFVKKLICYTFEDIYIFEFEFAFAMKKLRSALAWILDDKEPVNSERYFMIITCFSSFVFLILLCVFHIIMNLKMAPVYLAGGSAIVLFFLYALVRFGNFLFIPKLSVTILGLIALDVTWYYKFLSFGPVLFFIFAFGALVIWVWEGKSLAFMLSFYVINIGVLFAIEYNTPSELFIYPNMKIRSLDIYLSFLLYSSLLIFLLSRVKNDFRRQQERASKSDKLKSAFLANMSHEIRTPMNAIVGFSELLEEETDHVKRLQYTSIIRNSSANLLKLLNDIIDLSRIDAGDLHLNYSNFSIQELFFEMNQIFSFELRKRQKTNVKLDYNLPDGDYIIHSDPYRLKQVISNLLSNAVKFTSRGTIDLSCQKKHGELIFSISDTGTGIPDDDQKRVFERFTSFNYQGMNTEGTGIGLSVVSKIVEVLHGRIWLKSRVGEGTCFYFTIPYVTSKTVSIPINEAQMIDESNISEGRKRVLVVEDDKTSFLLLKEILKKMNLEVHHEIDGKAAIEFILTNPEPHLILMDIKLPFVDGNKALAEIKKIYPNVPIIAQTAYALLGDKEKAISIGFDDYITKPLDPHKLKELVKTHLSNK